MPIPHEKPPKLNETNKLEKLDATTLVANADPITTSKKLLADAVHPIPIKQRFLVSEKDNTLIDNRDIEVKENIGTSSSNCKPNLESTSTLLPDGTEDTSHKLASSAKHVYDKGVEFVRQHITEKEQTSLPKLSKPQDIEQVKIDEPPNVFVHAAESTKEGKPTEKLYDLSESLPKLADPATNKTFVERIAQKVESGKELAREALDYAKERIDVSEPNLPDLSHVLKDKGIEIKEFPSDVGTRVKTFDQPAKSLDDIAQSIPKTDFTAPEVKPAASQATTDFSNAHQFNPESTTFQPRTYDPLSSKQAGAVTDLGLPKADKINNPTENSLQLNNIVKETTIDSHKGIKPTEAQTTDANAGTNGRISKETPEVNPLASTPSSAIETKTIARSEANRIEQTHNCNEDLRPFAVPSEKANEPQKHTDGTMTTAKEQPVANLRKRESNDPPEFLYFPIGPGFVLVDSHSKGDQFQTAQQTIPQGKFEKAASERDASVIISIDAKTSAYKSTPNADELSTLRQTEKTIGNSAVSLSKKDESQFLEQVPKNVLKIEPPVLRLLGPTTGSTKSETFLPDKPARADGQTKATHPISDRAYLLQARIGDQRTILSEQFNGNKEQVHIHQARTTTDGASQPGQSERMTLGGVRQIEQPTKITADSLPPTNKDGFIGIKTPLSQPPRSNNDIAGQGKPTPISGGLIQPPSDGIAGRPINSKIDSLSTSDKRHLTGAEIAIATIIAAAGTAKLRVDDTRIERPHSKVEQTKDETQPDLITTDKSQTDKESAPGFLPELHIVGDAVSLIEGDCEEARASDLQPNGPEANTNVIKSKSSVLHRPTCLVSKTDTLQSIAEELYHDANLGWLIADLNSSSLKQQWIDGKRIVELSSRQEICLPVWQDVVYFYQNRPSNATPENLVTIVMETVVDRELRDLTLGVVMGGTTQPVTT